MIDWEKGDIVVSKSTGTKVKFVRHNNQQTFSGYVVKSQVSEKGSFSKTWVTEHFRKVGQ